MHGTAGGTRQIQRLILAALPPEVGKSERGPNRMAIFLLAKGFSADQQGESENP